MDLQPISTNATASLLRITNATASMRRDEIAAATDKLDYWPFVSLLWLCILGVVYVCYNCSFVLVLYIHVKIVFKQSFNILKHTDDEPVEHCFGMPYDFMYVFPVSLSWHIPTVPQLSATKIQPRVCPQQKNKNTHADSCTHEFPHAKQICS